MKQKYRARLVKTPQMAAQCALSKGTLRELRRKCGENVGLPRSREEAAKASAVQGVRLGCPPVLFRRSTPAFYAVQSTAWTAWAKRSPVLGRAFSNGRSGGEIACRVSLG